jgi:hypothetical protein
MFAMRFFAVVRLFATLVAVTLLSWPNSATADASLWGIASPLIPDDAKGVLYVDGASLKSSTVFTQLKPTLFGLEHGAVDGIEKTCNVDLAASFSNALLVLNHDEEPIFFIETSGLDLKRITACINALAKRENEKVKVTSKGSIVEVATGSKKSYFGWISGKVAVIVNEAYDRDRLSKALTKAKKRFDANPNIKTQLAEIDRTATAWGIFMDLPGRHKSEKPERLHGWLNLAAGKATAEVRGDFAGADKAASVAKTLNEELTEAKADIKKNAKRFGAAAPGISRLLGAVKIVGTGNEVVGTATATQADIVEVAQAAVEKK